MTSLPELPPNPSLLTRVRIGWKALLVASNDPGNPEAGARINDCFELETYAHYAELFRTTADGQRLLDGRPSLDADSLDLPALKALPEGSLGHTFACLFDLDGVEPFVTRQPITTDAQYLSKRYRETHDLYHILTGYHTDLAGEMELQAFVHGNLGIKSALMIVPSGFVMGLLGLSYMDGDAEPGPFPPLAMLRRFKAAYDRGVATPPLLSFPFEDHWATPLDEVRALAFGTPHAVAA